MRFRYPGSDADDTCQRWEHKTVAYPETAVLTGVLG